MATKEAFQNFLRSHTDDEVLINQITADCPREDSLHFDMALKYFDLGWSIIPLRPKSKKPLIAWEKYQHQLPTMREVGTWWRENPTAGIGVVMGKISGVFCVDVDGDQGRQILAEVGIDLEKSRALIQQTPRGRHYFFTYPDTGISHLNFDGGEVRSDGHYVNVYPSIHPSGQRYKWIQSPFEAKPAPPPKTLIKFANTGRKKSSEDCTPNENHIVQRGQRNNTLTSLAGTIRRRGLNANEIFEAIRTVNLNRCRPPLPESEVRGIANGMQRYASQSSLDAPEVTTSDFFAYMPMHKYIFVPSREMWPASSVNARIPPIAVTDKEGNSENEKPRTIAANAWLDRHQPVETMTWAPGEPMLIKGRLISHGGWIDRSGCTTFNLYRPPIISLGDSTKADRWVELVHRIYPDNAQHIITWLAHRVQQPGKKINHALLLGGLQGIGKDSLLEPVKLAVGPWNFQEISPIQLLGRFNGFVKSVILRVSEAHDLGELNRYAFYERLKAYTAAPPDVLQCDEKHVHEYYVFNLCGVIITTNYKTDGIYLPADDRRHYVAWSELTKNDFETDYWTNLYRWYENGGTQHVAAYLKELDISKWDAKGPPPKTAAFWDIVDANRAPEDAELADVLDVAGNPDAVTLREIASRAGEALRNWLNDRKNSRQIPHRMEDAGYMRVRNDAAKDGLWVLEGKRQVVYAKRELSVRERIIAAQNHLKDR